MQHNMLNLQDSLLLVVDVQEKFIPTQLYKEQLVKNTAIMVEAAGILGIPVIAFEQYPKGLGKTVPEISSKFPKNIALYEKNAFSCCNHEGFKEILQSYNKKQIIICGIEAHVCMHQTVSGLLSWGYQVHLVKDALSSRKESDYNIGVERMINDGAILTSTEMSLFELMVNARHPNFKEVQALIK